MTDDNLEYFEIQNGKYAGNIGFTKWENPDRKGKVLIFEVHGQYKRIPLHLLGVLRRVDYPPEKMEA
jgi:hypothetical protein